MKCAIVWTPRRPLSFDRLWLRSRQLNLDSTYLDKLRLRGARLGIPSKGALDCDMPSPRPSPGDDVSTAAGESGSDSILARQEWLGRESDAQVMLEGEAKFD